MVAQTTIQQIRTFCKPGLEAGLIDRDQFRELLKLAKSSTSDSPESSKPAACMLTAAQVAERLQCSVKTVYRLRDSGTLPGRYLTDSRKSLRFPESAVASFINGEVNHAG